jgi:hypothetical protein
MIIRVHIDRLVLDGIPLEAHGGNALRQAVTSELTRLLSTEGEPLGLSSSGGAVPRMSVGTVELARGQTGTHRSAATVLGTQVAHAIYRGLRK